MRVRMRGGTALVAAAGAPGGAMAYLFTPPPSAMGEDRGAWRIDPRDARRHPRSDRLVAMRII